MLTDKWTLSALLAGTATAILVLALVGSQSTKAAAPPPSNASDTGTVVVATAFVPAGTPLTPDRLQVRSAPRETIPTGAASSLDQLIGKRALDPLYRGEPILRARVSNGGGRAPVLVAPGRTVFALPLDPPHAVGGIIAAGDVVSVIGPPSSKRDDPPVLLVDNVVVLGLAGEVPFGGQVPIPGSSKSGDTTTPTSSPLGGLSTGRDAQKIALIDVTLEQAQQLAQAIESGRVFVALKSVAQDEVGQRPALEWGDR